MMAMLGLLLTGTGRARRRRFSGMGRIMRSMLLLIFGLRSVRVVKCVHYGWFDGIVYLPMDEVCPSDL